VGAVVACLVAAGTTAEEGKAAAEPELDGNVIVGTEANFDAVIDTAKYALVEFYAPWCGHCKELAPEYASAANTLAEQESPIVLVKVDVTENDALGQRFNIESFPTLKFFVGDKPPVEYNGGRTADDIVTWVTKKSGPNPIPITSIEEADKFLADSPAAAVGYFEKKEDLEAQAYIDAADLSEVIYYIVTDEAVAAHLKVTKTPKIAFYAAGEDAAVEFEGGEDQWEAARISQWVVGTSLPLVIEFNEGNAPKIFDGPLKKHLLVFVGKSSDKHESIVSGMKTVAQKFRGRLLFITVDTDEADHGRILEFFGISADEVPAYRLITIADGMVKYAPEEANEVTAETLDAFATSYFDGSLKPHLKSQETPEDWDAKPVKVLTATNFKDVAYDDTKDVLVEFYAPWCGHCKHLAPLYDQLGEAYEHDDSVVIAKIDATENELAEITVESFPTIYFFGKAAKAEAAKKGIEVSPEEFSGDHELNTMLEFMEQKTGVTGQISEDSLNAAGQDGDEPSEPSGSGEEPADDAEKPAEAQGHEEL